MSRVFINGAGGRIGRGITREWTLKKGQDYKLVLNEPRGIDFVVE